MTYTVVSLEPTPSFVDFAMSLIAPFIAAKNLRSPYINDGGRFSAGSRSKSSNAPASNHVSRKPPRSIPRCMAHPQEHGVEPSSAGPRQHVDPHHLIQHPEQPLIETTHQCVLGRQGCGASSNDSRNRLA